MFEPVLSLQGAIRSRLINKQAVTDLVPADHIRAGSTRPDKLPCIIISDGNTALHGHDYTSQRAAIVNLDLHIWTLKAGQDAAKNIAGAVMAALDKRTLQIEGGYCDDFRLIASRFPRDPDPEYGHAILSVQAVIRWFV